MVAALALSYDIRYLFENLLDFTGVILLNAIN